MSEMMAQEYKAEFPSDDDPNTKTTFGQGFRSFKSDSLDYLLDQLEHLEPEAMILGGMSESDLDYYRLGSYKFYGDPSG